jgi:hypothetical protein
MGDLGLDLSSSKAKVVRAREHLETLNAKIGGLLEKRKPCTVTISQIDQKTGWATVTLTCQDIDTEHIGIYVGDVIHNLRCALDYITASLAVASGVPVHKQQFPIEDDLATYAAKYGTLAAPNIKALFLKGIIHGLGEIERLQPYHLQPDPHAHPLWHIARFSNADKHREIAGFFGVPNKVNLTFEPDPVEKESLPIPDWQPQMQCEIQRVRFSQPYPPEIRFKRKVAAQILFTTSARGSETTHPGIGPDNLTACCDLVDKIIGIFEAL